MTPDELLRQLYDDTLVGNGPSVLELTQTGLGLGLGPETLLYDSLIPALEEVGARFERGDFFVPEMLIAGKAMAGALEILRPLLAETGAATIGKIVMVGGAPVTQEYADVVGADGYAADASAAVVRAKELLQRRRAALPA